MKHSGMSCYTYATRRVRGRLRLGSNPRIQLNVFLGCAGCISKNWRRTDFPTAALTATKRHDTMRVCCCKWQELCFIEEEFPRNIPHPLFEKAPKCRKIKYWDFWRLEDLIPIILLSSVQHNQNCNDGMLVVWKKKTFERKHKFALLWARNASIVMHLARQIGTF